MHTPEQLIELSQSEFHLPQGENVTDEYIDAAEQVLRKQRSGNVPYPTLRMVNQETRQTESVTANAAELILKGHLPLIEMMSSGRQGGNVPFIMSRVSVLQMALVESVGLDAEYAAISVPPREGDQVGRFMELGGYHDEASFAKVEERERTIADLQSYLRDRYSRRAIFKTGKRETTFEVVGILSEEEARAEVAKILGEQGYGLSSADEGPGINAIAPQERGIPTPIRLSSEYNPKLAANEALKILREDPNSVFGPQTYLSFSSGKFVTFGEQVNS